MARIDHIKRRLENWSRWSLAKSAGALGFSSASPLTRIGIPRSSMHFNVSTDSDSECMETERAVLSLRTTQIDLWKTLNLYYIKGYDIARCASIERISVSSISARLGRADSAIEAWLSAQKEVEIKAKKNKAA